MFKKITEKFLKRNGLFHITVTLPALISILYFSFFASDVYISEAKFVVRSPDKPTASGLGVLLKSAGFSNAGDEVYAAKDYILSRDALRELNGKNEFVTAYSGPSTSIFDRFGTIFSGGTFEDLYKYYRKEVSVDYDSTSSITTLTVRAFNAGDAHDFNERLLEIAEATVNRLNARAREDLIRFAGVEVEGAKARARDAALALSTYRDREGVVDPEKQAAIQLQMISKLQDELIATRTQLLQVKVLAPKNPQIEGLETRAKELARQIEEEQRKVAGGQKSLSATAVQYQRLALESQFADKQLAATMTSLEDARSEARRKQAYVERIAEPSKPDEALEPRRLRGILATLVIGLAAWGILSMLLAGVREHRD